ncbi:MAG: hypothetical protein IAE99_12400 [Rhodothermales bacterium]|nr:hypothetical protein [Rhodothermales bacterium]
MLRSLLVVAAALLAAPRASAQVPLDTLRARAVRVEAHFFAGRTAALRAMADSALATKITDAMHEAVLLQLVAAPDLAATAEWDVTTDEAGRLALVRPYRIAGQARAFVVVFDEAGRMVNLLMRVAER